jgi:hypothetical protein
MRIVMTYHARIRATAIVAAAALIGGCSSTPPVETQAMPTSVGAMNALTPAEQGAGWRLLFDGSNLNSWRGYKAADVPAGWHVANGELTKERPVEDIVSKEEFGDFELQVDWRIGEAGNSGIFYRGSEEFEKIYWTAPEYQLLDDIKAADNKTRLTCAGAAYGLYPSPPGHLNPVGQWNTTRIVAKGAHVEHWLNGYKLLEYDLWSPDWEAKMKASKFAAWPKYGRLRSGHLAIQGDHNGSLSFRNIKIRSI